MNAFTDSWPVKMNYEKDLQPMYKNKLRRTNLKIALDHNYLSLFLLLLVN